MSPGTEFTVDPSNEGARHGWDGDDGAYWAEHEDYFDRSVAGYHDAFFDATAIAPADHVLDVGCGVGSTTRDAARLAHQGSALGIDLSARMLERARARAQDERITNATFVHADAQIHRFEPESFDRVISRAGAMFFGDPIAAFTNVGRSMRRGATMTLLVWQPMTENEWFVEFRAALFDGRAVPTPPPADAPGPFSLGDPTRVRAILSESGFVDIGVEGVARPMEHGRTPDEAFDNVRGMGFFGFILQSLDRAAQTRVLDALRASIDAHATDTGVYYGSATWIVSATHP